MFRRILITCALVGGLPLVARADYPITQIAVTGDPAPDGGTFTSFGLPTANRESFDTGLNPFFFEATKSNGVSGVYYYTFSDSRQLLQAGTVADTTTMVPQGGATFTSFSNLSSGFSELGFIAMDSSGNQGVYATGDFPLSLIAKPTDIGPTGVPFGQFRSISIMSAYNLGYPGGEIATNTGIYEFDPNGGPGGAAVKFYRISDTSITPPGAPGAFTSYGPISYKNIQQFNLAPGTQAYIQAVHATAGGLNGIYYGLDSETDPIGNTSASLVKMAAVGDAAPGPDGKPDASGAIFTSFGDPVATSNEITFAAHYGTAGSDQQGIFTYGPYGSRSAIDYHMTSLVRIVSTGDVAPDSGGATFTDFLDVSDAAVAQLFVADLSDGSQGLYISESGELTKIIGTGETIDGRTVDGVTFGPDSIGQAFRVDFTDDTQGLYFWTVPEPASLSLLALSALLIPIRRRSRKLEVKKTIAMVDPLEQRRLLSSALPAATGELG